MAKSKKFGEGGSERVWEVLLGSGWVSNKTTLAALLASGVLILVNGPLGLLLSAGVNIALAKEPVGDALRVIRRRRRRQKAMYLLPDQTQNLNILRGQLVGDKDVLIARYGVRGRIHERFVGDKNEPYQGVPTEMIMPFRAILRAADKDSNNCPAVLFFGRPL